MTELNDFKYSPGENPSLLNARLTDVVDRYYCAGRRSELKDFFGKLHEEVEDPFLKNKILNKIELLEKKTVLASKPASLAVILTKKCNLNCRMCWGDVDWDMPEKKAGEITDLMPYMELLEWVGGEVFMSKYFERLYGAATRHPHIFQRISTNAVLMTAGWMERFAENGTQINISIDGTSRKTYEYFRRGASFDGLLDKLELIRSIRKNFPGSVRKDILSRPLLCMNFLVMRDNYKEVAGTIPFAKKYGIEHINFLDLRNENDEEYNRQKISGDPEISGWLKKTFAVMEKEAGKAGITYTLMMPLAGVRRCSPADLKPPSMPCAAPWLSMFMQPGGIKPHFNCLLNTGDTEKEGLLELWNGKGMRSYREKIVNNDRSDICRGDCIMDLLKNHFVFDV